MQENLYIKFEGNGIKDCIRMQYESELSSNKTNGQVQTMTWYDTDGPHKVVTVSCMLNSDASPSACRCRGVNVISNLTDSNRERRLCVYYGRDLQGA